MDSNTNSVREYEGGRRLRENGPPTTDHGPLTTAGGEGGGIIAMRNAEFGMRDGRRPGGGRVYDLNEEWRMRDDHESREPRGESRGDGLPCEAIQGNMGVHIMYTSEVCLCRGRL